MPSLKQKSKPAGANLTLLAVLVAVVAAMAMPAAGLAAPPPEPEPPQLSFEPGSHDFGLQPINNGSGQANFQLRNNGSEVVQVNSIEITGSGSEAFFTNTNCPGYNLQPGETCYVQVYFSPHDTSEYVAQLRANAGPYSFTADLSGRGGQAMITPVSNPTDFGSTPVGSAGVTHEIALTNVGNMPGGAFIAVIAGGAVGSFQLLDENCTGHLLVPGATCTLQVRFRPLSEGAKTAMLGLFGDSDGGTQIVLTGVGSAAEPAADEAPPANGTSSVNAAPESAATTQARTHRRRPRIRRQHRRANLHSAHRAVGVGGGSGPEGR